jgi:tetratricopeptide (TPR) repeat protein
MKARSFFAVSACCLIAAGCAGMVAQPQVPAVEIADGDKANTEAQYRAAITHYTRAIESGGLATGELAGVYVKRGRAYFDEFERDSRNDADLIASLKDFTEAHTMAPDLADALVGEGNAYQALGAYAEALTAFEAGYAVDRPQPLYSLLGIGATYRVLGDYANAMRYYDRALQIWGNSTMQIFYNRGLAFYADGKYREAVDALTRAIPRQRDYALAYVYRACALTRLHEFNLALADYDDAIRFWKQDAAHYGHTGTYGKVMERFVAERAAVSDMSKGAKPPIAEASLCQAFPSSDKKRARSRLLPRDREMKPLPQLHILPLPEFAPSGPAI